MLGLEIFYVQMNRPFRLGFVSFTWLPPENIELTDNEFFGLWCMGGEI